MPKKSHPLSEEEKTIRSLSDRIVKAQQPIRILDAIKWNDQIRHDFFKHQFKKQPHVNKNYYDNIPLGFDPEQKIEEFYIIEKDVKSQLGRFGAASDLMQDRCREYQRVVDLLLARGSKQFTQLAQGLYGGVNDVFYPGAPSLKDLSHVVGGALINIAYGKEQIHTEKDKNIYNATEAVAILSKKLNRYFGGPNKVHVKVSDDIISDAAAGADTIKLRSDLIFSKRVLRLYEVHEGWVHLGTTLNGLEQPICTFLGKGPPSSTVTQEGLAMLTEIFTFSSYPDRVKRLTNRIIAISMAEDGAHFIDVFHFFREQGIGDEESYQNTVRIFRGSTPTGGPFTKDLAYSQGFILIYNYLRLSIQQGSLSHIPLLFAGKTSLKNIHLLGELVQDRIVSLPKYIPPQFSDQAALSAWMSYSLFLNRLDLQKLSKVYRDIL